VYEETEDTLTAQRRLHDAWLSLESGEIIKTFSTTSHRWLLFFLNFFIVFNFLSHCCLISFSLIFVNSKCSLPKKAIELLDAVTSVPYSRKGLGCTTLTREEN
jgi:hypothetical protein